MKYLSQHLIYVFACLPIASFGVETSKPSKGFDASIGIGIASTPKYEGSKKPCSPDTANRSKTQSVRSFIRLKWNWLAIG